MDLTEKPRGVRNAFRAHRRLLTQIGFFAATNAYLPGFLQGKLYTGATKQVCLPGLNCYSCPGALGSCPIGAMQNVAAGRGYHASLYVIGFLVMIGAALGRFACGWLCPFGLFQELMHRIPHRRKKPRKRAAAPPPKPAAARRELLRRADRAASKLPYAVLALLVLTLPDLIVNFVGQGTPWFCKLLCPSGTLLAGIPLAAADAGIRASLGPLFAWKVALLAGFAAWSVFRWRPFCKYVCPLGAIYGLFNPVSLYRIRVDETRCTRCGKCRHACGFDIRVFETPNSAACVRCGACVSACPEGALRAGFGSGGKLLHPLAKKSSG